MLAQSCRSVYVSPSFTTILRWKGRYEGCLSSTSCGPGARAIALKGVSPTGTPSTATHAHGRALTNSLPCAGAGGGALSVGEGGGAAAGDAEGTETSGGEAVTGVASAVARGGSASTVTGPDARCRSRTGGAVALGGIVEAAGPTGLAAVASDGDVAGDDSAADGTGDGNAA